MINCTLADPSTMRRSLENLFVRDEDYQSLVSPNNKAKVNGTPSDSSGGVGEKGHVIRVTRVA
jgi:hypothetical protein